MPKIDQAETSILRLWSRFLVPPVARAAIRTLAVGDDGNLSAEQHRAAHGRDSRGRRDRRHALRHVLRLTEDHAVVLAERARIDRVVAHLAALHRRLLNVEPLTGARVLAQARHLIGMQVEHVFLAALDVERADHVVADLRHFDRVVDQVEGERVGSRDALIVGLAIMMMRRPAVLPIVALLPVYFSEVCGV